MGENLHSALIEGLKLIGLARGTEEIKKTETAESKRTAAFLKNDYPKMQEEGRRGLVEVFLLRAKAAKNPAMRDSDLLTAQSWAEASGDPKLIAKVKEAKENPK
jgi:hypothetical protein